MGVGLSDKRADSIIRYCQFAGIYVRPPENLLVFPVAVYDAVHDAVHAGVHQLVQRRILFHAIPSGLVSYLTSETGD